ncbi:uncharacterized protein C24B11.05 isoform X2 [Cornus florida]|uniref:uncharacterized protein C24B11.05 isoform X2 n=1 Tax=Cornus florida TaxID=4283 RepID=UPI0028A28512|nr:uncharacterized protein C24B11.05 isoform X2 [Cornus florida]
MDAGGRYGGTKYQCLLFDMDDTLYPMSSGINLACRRNIEDFMLRHLHIDENEVPRMCLELYREYGTTMAGLKALGYQFDNDQFHAFVHGKLPYEALKPDPVLRNLLLSMPQRKIIFTNADKEHAAQVLKRLGLEDCFEGVICFETLNPATTTLPEPVDYISMNGTSSIGNAAVIPKGLEMNQADSITDTDQISYIDRFSSKSPILCKPSVQAIQAAIKIANVDPNKTVGSTTLVAGADHALSSIHNIKEALPEIWEGEEKRGEEEEEEQHKQVIRSTAVETIVIA